MCPSPACHVARRPAREPTPARAPRRSLNERALQYCGGDFHAHVLWDGLLRAKRVLSDSHGLAALYARLLGEPLRDLERYHRE